MKITEENIIENIKSSKNFASLIKSINKNEELKIPIINETQYLNDVTIYERLYCIKENIINNKCTICNTKSKIFDLKYKCYKNWCDSNICKKEFISLNKDQDIEKLRIQKIKDTKSKYTIEQKKAIIDKQKQTNIEKYGVDSYSKSDMFKQHMLDTYGYISPFELKETHQKSKKTLQDKYGVEHNFKIEGIQKKIENTFTEKYNVTRPGKNKTIRDKIIKTNNDKYNGNSPMCSDEIKKKAKNTHLSNFEFYGLSNPETLKKYKNTMMERYGYESTLHDEEHLYKLLNSSRKYKIYKFPSGKEVFIQGYEDYVIDQLLLEYNESDIIISNKEITQNIGIIYYKKNGNIHKYYPDIYIKSENKIIEVKSAYTYEKDLETNILKMNACINAGFKFEFKIIDKKEYKRKATH